MARVALAFGRTTTAPTTANVPDVSDQTLQSAGVACQKTLSPSVAALVQQIDTCIASHGITTAQTGSPLTDILLLNPNSTNVHSVVSECVSTAKQ